MLENMVGLEAEFILRNQEGNIVFPDQYGFDADALCVLGEFRGSPGSCPAEVLGDFFTQYYKVSGAAQRQGLAMDLTGHAQISPEVYAKVLRRANTKEVARCANVYGTDILSLSDQVIRRGKVVGMNVSTGLHIHFSSGDHLVREISCPKYENVVLPIGVAGETTKLMLSRHVGYDITDRINLSVSRITKPVIVHFVTKLDEVLLKKYKSATKHNLKYRQPGWYEMKPWGFEYRSLPFDTQTLQDLFKIITFAFDLFEDL